VKELDGGKLAHVSANLAQHAQGGGHVDAVDAGEIDATHFEQMRAQVELRCIAAAAALLARTGLVSGDLESLQLLFDFTIAVVELGAEEIEQLQRLLEREQVFVAPVATQAAGNLLVAGANALVLQCGQDLAVAFAGDDGAQDLLSGLAHHVGNDVGQLNVHLRQRLLHVLHMARL
jgi:hypothetical protein